MCKEERLDSRGSKDARDEVQERRLAAPRAQEDEERYEEAHVVHHERRDKVPPAALLCEARAELHLIDSVKIAQEEARDEDVAHTEEVASARGDEGAEREEDGHGLAVLGNKSLSNTDHDTRPKKIP